MLIYQCECEQTVEAVVVLQYDVTVIKTILLKFPLKIGAQLLISLPLNALSS